MQNITEPNPINSNVSNSNNISKNNHFDKRLLALVIFSGLSVILLLIRLVSVSSLLSQREQDLQTIETKNQNQTQLIPQITHSPTNLSQVPSASPEPFSYPKMNLGGEEGTAYIEDQYSYNYFKNQNFILVLTKQSEKTYNQATNQFETTKKSRYSIKLSSSVDSVSEPIISYNYKYGCVTLQASGYVGSYVFNISTGEGLDIGKQYSKCLDWIDENRVIIWERLYDRNKVTYYVYNADTEQKSVLSSVNISKP